MWNKFAIATLLGLTLTCQAMEEAEISDYRIRSQLREEIGFRPFLALGAPHLLNIGSLLKRTWLYDWTAQGGLFGIPIGSERNLFLWNIETQMRFHPLDAGFFVSAGLRYASITLGFNLPQLSDAAGATPNTARLRLAGFTVVTSLGWRFQVGETSWISCSLGLQFPLLNGGSFKITQYDSALENPSGIASLEASASTVADYYAKMVIPSVTLFEYGWEF